MFGPARTKNEIAFVACVDFIILSILASVYSFGIVDVSAGVTQEEVNTKALLLFI